MLLSCNYFPCYRCYCRLPVRPHAWNRPQDKSIMIRVTDLTETPGLWSSTPGSGSGPWVGRNRNKEAAVKFFSPIQALDNCAFSLPLQEKAYNQPWYYKY
ncbi:hypothetical protein PoB_000222000 [Plakobranchus ocellatus]|uniref:Uncharacterized protein n=1 Tax=Plakobranchus ocellatus TaxID=259542 RepID=A0AAV3XZ42_9GAST|nr:hypothetical protein PoB_000222000 [Plakobranchus ocellatus]